VLDREATRSGSLRQTRLVRAGVLLCSAPMTDAPQSLRDGRYRVVGVLGEGAQATTFDAVDTRSGLAVAVKRFRVHGARNWKEVELAEREATVLAGLSHPLLPRYVEHFEERGELFLVTEKIEGESLSSLRRRGGAFDEAAVMRLLRDAASALGYLHGHTPPIVHRDLKPSNVIRRRDGSFVFIDFGAVRDRMKPEGGSTVVGTFGYMAPEQFQGRAMPASDVYAIGATALSLLTGREPEDLPHRGLGIDVPAALEGFRVRPELVAMLSAMLTPAPEERLQAIVPLTVPNAAETEEPAPGVRRRARRGSQAGGEAEHVVTSASPAPRTGPCRAPRKAASRADGRCSNPTCDKGLVGDDVCPVCRGSGEAEPAPEPRRRGTPVKRGGTSARCPNPACDSGLVGNDVCPVCRGSGEAEPAALQRRKGATAKAPPQEAEGDAEDGNWWGAGILIITGYLAFKWCSPDHWLRDLVCIVLFVMPCLILLSRGLRVLLKGLSFLLGGVLGRARNEPANAKPTASVGARIATADTVAKPRRARIQQTAELEKKDRAVEEEAEESSAVERTMRR
jgi:hypothetical protein